jgi:hypothetical protein
VEQVAAEQMERPALAAAVVEVVAAQPADEAAAAGEPVALLAGAAAAGLEQAGEPVALLAGAAAAGLEQAGQAAAELAYRIPACAHLSSRERLASPERLAPARSGLSVLGPEERGRRRSKQRRQATAIYGSSGQAPFGHVAE